MHTPLNQAIKLNSGTFENDDKLPRLPVPQLRKTFELYLASIRAVSPENKVGIISEKIDEFVKSSEGRTLQEGLKSRKTYKTNWLEEWWLDEAYLKGRSAMVPYLNIAGRSTLYKTIWPLIDTRGDTSQPLVHEEIIRRASRYVYSILLFWVCLRQEMLVTHRTKDGTLLCMDQLKKVFNTCRIPNENKDDLLCSFRIAKDGICPNHIIVGCHGRIFIISGVTDKDEVFAIESIEHALRQIVNVCHKKGHGHGLATLSSLPRDEWNNVYKQLRQVCHQNAINIDLIQNSILWISLSTEEPPNPQLLIEKAVKIDARNVWADKSIYISFLSNGLITYGANHAPVDGIALGTAIGFCEKEISCSNGYGPSGLPELSSIQHCESKVLWKELHFKIPVTFPELIENALLQYLDLCSNIEAQTFTFSNFNRLISRKLKLHPDTVFQLCLQLAYVRIHGINVPATVYETATTRKFSYGRTETIRSCTEEAVKWMKAFNKLGPDDLSVGELFLKAHDAHNQLRTRCENGGGCDRHIMGLKMMSKIMLDFPTPLLDDILNDPSFIASGSNGNFILSTSPMGSSDVMGVVAPMCANGYGVFYRIVENFCEAAVTSWRSEGHGRGSKLLEELNNCFRFVPKLSRLMLKTKL